MGKKILLIDDAAIIRIVLASFLTDAGYEVVGEASNGMEGIQLFKKLKPDIVTMDILMPDMNGIDAVKIIRDIDPKAKIVMCTTLGQKYMVLNAIQAGAANYILKPFNKEKVLEVIEKTIEATEAKN